MHLRGLPSHQHRCAQPARHLVGSLQGHRAPASCASFPEQGDNDFSSLSLHTDAQVGRPGLKREQFKYRCKVTPNSERELAEGLANSSTS